MHRTKDKRHEALQTQKLIQLVIDRDLTGISKLFTYCERHLIDKIESEHGRTALIKSIENYDEELFGFLTTEMSANPSQPDNRRKTPLMYACENGCINIVETLCGLLNANDINAVDCDLKTSLHYSMVAQSRRHRRCTEVMSKKLFGPHYFSQWYHNEKS
jgi:ankyrin repeat protein